MHDISYSGRLDCFFGGDTMRLENSVIEEVKKEPIRSKSWEEFCNNHPTFDEWYVTDSPKPMMLSGANLPRIRYSLETKEDAEGILVLIQLTRLHNEWVDGWVPNWEDMSQTKYIVYYYGKTLVIDSTASFKRLLAFPTREMAVEFLTCFKDLIEKAKKFI